MLPRKHIFTVFSNLAFFIYFLFPKEVYVKIINAQDKYNCDFSLASLNTNPHDFCQKILDGTRICISISLYDFFLLVYRSSIILSYVIT